MPLRQGPQGPGGFAPATGGGGSGFSTELPVMQQARNRVQETHDAMVARVNQLMAECEGLGASSWEGGGAQAFHAAHAQWGTAQAQLSKALQEIVAGLDTSQQHYGQADANSQTAIANAVRSLP